MKDKNSNLVANKLVKAFLKNKIINPISSKYTKKLTNAQKFRKLCESKIKKILFKVITNFKFNT